MRCREYREDLMELARGGPARRGLLDHLEGCRECARFLDDQTALTAAMQSLADDAGAPGAALERLVMAELPMPRVPVWR